MKPLPNTTCPLCGGSNHCAPASAGTFDVACWCTKVRVSRQALDRVPAESIDKACLCPRCAGALDAKDVERPTEAEERRATN